LASFEQFHYNPYRDSTLPRLNPGSVLAIRSRGLVATDVVFRTSVVMETLEFIIFPDGRVQEKVTGITGSSCAEVTAAIEAQLGTVVIHQPTSEFYAQAQVTGAIAPQTTALKW